MTPIRLAHNEPLRLRLLFIGASNAHGYQHAFPGRWKLSSRCYMMGGDYVTRRPSVTDHASRLKQEGQKWTRIDARADSSGLAQHTTAGRG